jgi:hypothetical protein
MRIMETGPWRSGRNRRAYGGRLTRPQEGSTGAWGDGSERFGLESCYVRDVDREFESLRRFVSPEVPGMRVSWPLVCALVAASAAPAAAASVGPDSYGYVAKDTSYSFIDLSTSSGATPRHTVLQDDGTVTESIGFTFNFYGTDYTQVSWSPNGLLTFGGASSDWTNVDLSTTAPEDDLASIAVFWDDLQYFTTGGDRSYFELFGSGSDRFLVIQWNDLFPYNGTNGTSSPGTFQVILFETTNVILFQYADLDFGDSNYDYGASATVGIRDVGGESNGYNLLWSHDSASLSDGQAIVFAVVPEPGTVALFGLGVAGLGASVVAGRRRRRRRAA